MSNKTREKVLKIKVDEFHTNSDHSLIFGKPSPGQVCWLHDCDSVRLGHLSPSPTGCLVTSLLLSLLPPPQARSQGPQGPHPDTKQETDTTENIMFSLDYYIFKESAPRPILSSRRDVRLYFCLSPPNVIL